MERRRYLAAVAWVTVIASAVAAVSVADMDILAPIMVCGAAFAGGVLALLAGNRRHDTIAQAPAGDNVATELERTASH